MALFHVRVIFRLTSSDVAPGTHQQHEICMVRRSLRDRSSLSSRSSHSETCIKGHRSSTCKHTDRPLFEIKKKGRPVTQCEHCRELRKTKQVHVKCVCEPHDDANPKGSSCKKKGVNLSFNPSLSLSAHPQGRPHPSSVQQGTGERRVSLWLTPSLGSVGCHAISSRETGIGT